MCQFCGCEAKIDGEGLYHRERIAHNDLKSDLRKLVEKWRREEEVARSEGWLHKCADELDKLLDGGE